MNDQQEADVRAALDATHDARKVRFHLRRALGEDTECDEVNGHLFKPDDDECLVLGCEMHYRELAEDYDCPTPLESYDMDARINDGF